MEHISLFMQETMGSDKGVPPPPNNMKNPVKVGLKTSHSYLEHWQNRVTVILLASTSILFYLVKHYFKSVTAFISHS